MKRLFLASFFLLNLTVLGFSQSSTPEGSTAGDWTAEDTGCVGYDDVVLLEVNGKPAIVFSDSNTSLPTYAIHL